MYLPELTAVGRLGFARWNKGQHGSDSGAAQRLSPGVLLPPPKLEMGAQPERQNHTSWTGPATLTASTTNWCWQLYTKLPLNDFMVIPMPWVLSSVIVRPWIMAALCGNPSFMFCSVMVPLLLGPSKCLVSAISLIKFYHHHFFLGKFCKLSCRVEIS